MSSSSAPAPSSRHDAVQLERRDAHRGRVINRSAALQKRREEFAANARPVGAGTSTIYDWTTSLTASPLQLKAFDGAIEDLHDAVSVGNHEVWGDPLPSHLQYRKRDGEPDADTADAHTIAKRGVGGPGSPLPHGEVIQKAFGRHDLSDVKAHLGGHAQEASAALGAEAYATGSDIAFAGTPTLHTAAHEAAHIIQQRAGVSLKDGIGESGDRYERHADEVADAVVRGQSAEGILDRMAGGGCGVAVQLREPKTGGTAQTTSVDTGESAQNDSASEKNEPESQEDDSPAASGDGKAAAFEPEFRRPGVPFAVVGDEFELEFAMTNAQDAPADTKWTGASVSGHGEALDLKGFEGPVVHLEALADGTKTVAAELEVSGKTHRTPEVAVTIPRVLVNGLTIMKAGKQVSKLGVGEQATVQLALGNVNQQRSSSEPPISRVVGLVGAISRPGPARMVPGGKVEFDVAGNMMGQVEAEVSLGVWKVDVCDSTAPRAKFELAVEMKKEDFLAKCAQAQTIITVAGHKLTGFLAGLAIAYGRAWKEHTSVLAKAAARDRLIGEFILNAALAFIPGGVGGLVGGVMKKLGNGDFLVDGMKDLAKGTGRWVGAKALTIGAKPGLEAYPPDPTEWQNRETERVSFELAAIAEVLSAWQEHAGTEDVEMTFEPVEAIRELLVMNGQAVTELQPVAQETHAFDFERGFWEKWLELYGFELSDSGGNHYSRRVASPVGGSLVENRCRILGLDYARHLRAAQNKAARLSVGQPVQQSARRNEGGESEGSRSGAKSADAHAVAASGVGGAGRPIPYAETIQKSFGRHDISHVQAHIGGKAADASKRLGAEAYATGSHIAFRQSPTLHTAAHEAAHIVQQQAGVSLKDGIGESGDRYERHADEVADAVVQGKSAEGILDRMTSGGAAGVVVQRSELHEHEDVEEAEVVEDAPVPPSHERDAYGGTEMGPSEADTVHLAAVAKQLEAEALRLEDLAYMEGEISFSNSTATALRGQVAEIRGALDGKGDWVSVVEKYRSFDMDRPDRFLLVEAQSKAFDVQAAQLDKRIRANATKLGVYNARLKVLQSSVNEVKEVFLDIAKYTELIGYVEQFKSFADYGGAVLTRGTSVPNPLGEAGLRMTGSSGGSGADLARKLAQSMLIERIGERNAALACYAEDRDAQECLELARGLRRTLEEMSTTIEAIERDVAALEKMNEVGLCGVKRHRAHRMPAYCGTP